MNRLAAGLDEAGYDRAVAVAEAAELVRGYEEVKLRSVQAYRARRAELGLPLSGDVLHLLDGRVTGALPAGASSSRTP